MKSFFSIATLLATAAFAAPIAQPQDTEQPEFSALAAPEKYGITSSPSGWFETTDDKGERRPFNNDKKCIYINLTNLSTFKSKNSRVSIPSDGYTMKFTDLFHDDELSTPEGAVSGSVIRIASAPFGLKCTIKNGSKSFSLTWIMPLIGADGSFLTSRSPVALEKATISCIY